MPFDNLVPPPKRVESVLREIWATLESCTGSPGHAWRTPVLATQDPEGAAARIVVLRSASRRYRTLEFHTDSRSPKIAQLKKKPIVEWVFYDPTLQMQLRVRARAKIHSGDRIAADAWKRVPPSSYLNYLSSTPPGGDLSVKDPPPSKTEPSHPAFAVVLTTADHVDWLWLHPQGHRRARFKWHLNRWVGAWVQP